MGYLLCYKNTCGVRFWIEDALESRLRRTHEILHCPFGHSQYFPGKTDEEKKIEMLTRQVNDWRQIATERDDAFGTCPFECGYRSRSTTHRRWYWLLRHFESVHGVVMPHPTLPSDAGILTMFKRLREEADA